LEVDVLNKTVGWVLGGVAVIAALALPLMLPEKDTQDQILTLAILVCINAALASSWNIVGGFAGQVNLGHAAFFGLGSLVTRNLWLGGTPFPLAFLAGGAASAVAAFFLGWPGLRLKGIYFSIGTLALAEAIRISVGNFFPTVTTLPTEGLRDYSLVSRYYLSFGVLMLSVAVTIYLLNSKLGLGMFATREDEDAARSIGINIFRHKLAAFVISAGLAGLTGCQLRLLLRQLLPVADLQPGIHLQRADHRVCGRHRHAGRAAPGRDLLCARSKCPCLKSGGCTSPDFRRFVCAGRVVVSRGPR
jgi:branched-chain amino acid transport system permease protein